VYVVPFAVSVETCDVYVLNTDGNFSSKLCFLKDGGEDYDCLGALSIMIDNFFSFASYLLILTH
jgi:hypothetical protein